MYPSDADLPNTKRSGPEPSGASLLEVVSVPSRSTTRSLALVASSAAALAWLAGCSFVVESRDRQCERDADCAGLENAVCDLAGGVCVPDSSTTTTTSSGGCEGPDGCYACPPQTQVQFLEACTDAECIPYDNTQLEGLLEPDGSVPPVP